ncbi:MAG: CPBP family intramembrane metalloprotease [Firmicutes bacterium]|nr:CPBP family intramembrane metalloprotease [Bacillota bacterium]
MKRIKEILGVLSYPIIFLVVQFGIIILFTLIFNLTNNYEIGSTQYTNQLGLFFSNNRLWIVALTFISLIPLFKKNCNINKIGVNFKQVTLLILLGLSFAISYNLILLNLNITNLFDGSNDKLVMTLLTSGIIGPIMEELIFRNIVYEKLKGMYKPLTAIILTGLIFGLFHGNLIQFIYAFLFNFILIFVYEKSRSIYTPIIVHVSANSGIQLFLSLINYNNIYVKLFGLIISAMVLYLSFKIIKKQDSNI